MIYTAAKNNLRLEVDFDDSPCNPRKDFDPLCTIYQVGISRYDIGDEQISLEEDKNISLDQDNFCLPVYAYIHSGVSVSLKSYGCQFDSGRLGTIVLNKQDCQENQINFEDKNRLLEICQAEIEEYDKYLTGMIYQWRIYREDELIESCGTYFDKRDAIDEGIRHLDYEIEHEINKILGYVS